MKKAVFLFVFLPSLALGQVDSLSQALSYYPLGKGDYWEYESVASNSEPPFEQDTTLYSLEVTGDSLFSNELGYRKLKYKMIYPGGDSSYLYERVDSLTGYVFKYDTTQSNDEGKIGYLFADSGEAFSSLPNIPYPSSHDTAETSCRGTSKDSVLGTPTDTKTFNVGSLEETAYTLARGFGISGVYVSWDFGRTDIRLIYAKINDIQYGTPILASVSGRPVAANKFRLFQNYPNPFNPTTLISYQLSAVSHVTLSVYDVLGRRVKTLVDGKESAGEHAVEFDGSRLPSGVYFYRLDAGSYSKTMKLMLIK